MLSRFSEKSIFFALLTPLERIFKRPCQSLCKYLRKNTKISLKIYFKSLLTTPKCFWKYQLKIPMSCSIGPLGTLIKISSWLLCRSFWKYNLKILLNCSGRVSNQILKNFSKKNPHRPFWKICWGNPHLFRYIHWNAYLKIHLNCSADPLENFCKNLC